MNPHDVARFVTIGQRNRRHIDPRLIKFLSVINQRHINPPGIR